MVSAVASTALKSHTNNLQSLVVGASAVTPIHNEGIWSRILQEVSTRGNSPVQSSVIVLGNDRCGKSSLVNRLTKNAQNSGMVDFNSALEHNYIEVHADSGASYAYQLGGGVANGLLGPSDSATLAMWLLDGKQEFAELLQFAFPPQLSRCALILCASLEKPGNILPELRKWYRVFVEQISQYYKQDESEQSKQAQIRFWQEYVEPIESSQMMHSSIIAASDANATSIMNGGLIGTDSSLLLPPEQGVLDENCGAPIIVVITKSDLYTEVSPEQLDKVQYHVRQFCLHHGAALIYTSAKEERNTQLLAKYLAHRSYALPFTTPAYIVEKDSIFVPTGWDSEQKLALIKETLSDLEVPILPQPVGDAQSTIQRSSEVGEAEDEQLFLNRLATISPNATDAQIQTQLPVASGGHQSSSPRSSNTIKANTIVSGNLSQSTGDSTALASFFNSLLKKDTGDNAGEQAS